MVFGIAAVILTDNPLIHGHRPINKKKGRESNPMHNRAITSRIAIAVITTIFTLSLMLMMVPSVTFAAEQNSGAAFSAKITATDGGKVMTAGQNTVLLKDDANTTNQVWQFSYNEAKATYTLTSKATGQLLTVVSDENNASVQTATANHTSGQSWKIYLEKNNTFSLMPASSVRNVLSATADGTVQIKTDQKASSQSFKIKILSTSELNGIKAAAAPSTQAISAKTAEKAAASSVPSVNPSAAKPAATGNVSTATHATNANGSANASKPADTSTTKTATAPALANLGADFWGQIKKHSGSYYVAAESSGNAALYSGNNALDQLWHFERNSDGSYRITNAANSKCLDLNSGKDTNGTNIQTYAKNNSNAQKWGIYQRTDGTYYLMPKSSATRVLDIANNKTGDGTNLRLYDSNNSEAQKLTIVKANSASTANAHLGNSFVATLQHLSSGKVVTESAGNVVIQANKSYKDQGWQFTRNSDGSYLITSLADGKALDLANGTDANGTNIRVYAKNNSNAQRFYIRTQYSAATGYTYYLMPASSSTRVMDVNGNGSADNTNIQLYTKNDSKAQQFIINKASAANYSNRQTSRQKVIAIAKSQIGTRESGNGWTKYGAWYGDYVKSKYAFSNAAWCAMFVSWCGNQAGLPNSTFYYHAYCPSGVSWYQNKKQWHWKGYTPKSGDIVYYDWNGDSVTDHVGLVASYNKGTITTVEGNYSDQVKQRTINYKSSYVFGYASPNY